MAGLHRLLRPLHSANGHLITRIVRQFEKLKRKVSQSRPEKGQFEKNSKIALVKSLRSTISDRN